jgi:Tol biopolymer transport system component
MIYETRCFRKLFKVSHRLIFNRPTLIYFLDAATGATRQLTFERTAVNYPRWSPSGNAIAFISTDAAGKGQLFVLSMAGGEAKKISSSPTGVQQFAWSPDERSFAFVQEDELPNKKEIEKGYDAFEIKSNSMYLKAKPNPAHIWLISSSGGAANRLTAGSWTLPSTATFNLTSPAISWTPEGKQIAFQCNETAYSGELVLPLKQLI